MTCDEYYVFEDGECKLEELITSCALYNSLNYSICEVCNEGYVRVDDLKTCVKDCPEDYTLRRQE